MNALPRPVLLGILVHATSPLVPKGEENVPNLEDEECDEEMGHAGRVSNEDTRNSSSVVWNAARDVEETDGAGADGAYNSSTIAARTSVTFGYPPGSGGRNPPTPTSPLEAFLDGDIAKLVSVVTHAYSYV